MARIRTIKPDFWTDEKVVELSAFARLLFIGIWNFADDEGRIRLSEKKLRMQIFPADTVNISELLGEIRRESLITIYDIEGVSYLQVNGFSKHQKIDKRTPSKFPPSPRLTPESPRIPTTEGSRVEKEEEGKGKGSGVVARAKYSDFQKVYEAGCAVFPKLTSASPAVVNEWLEVGANPDRDILPEIRRIAANKSDVNSWAYFTGAVMDALKTRTSPLPSGAIRKPIKKKAYSETKKNVGMI
jgi:hypothetical protein